MHQLLSRKERGECSPALPACLNTCSTSPGGAGSLLPLLCGALFVFLVLIRASKCSLGSSCPLACLSSNETCVLLVSGVTVLWTPTEH